MSIIYYSFYVKYINTDIKHTSIFVYIKYISIRTQYRAKHLPSCSQQVSPIEHCLNILNTQASIFQGKCLSTVAAF